MELIDLETQLNKGFEISNSTICQGVSTANVTESCFGNTKPTANDTSRIHIEEPSRGALSKPYLVHQFTLPTLLYMANGIITMFLLLVHTFNIMSIGFWWAMTLFLTNQGALIPLTLILYYHPIRSYSARSIQYHLEYLFGGLQRLKSRFRRRELRKVNPISEQQI